ncbi:MAG: GNAT family N-acetyltransferase [Erythrobacter sp.]|nr:GNAT family N-acetyltransferase [Erythrobacter sp.]
MPDTDRFAIRNFEDADAEPLLTITRRAIATIGPRVYSGAQIEVWLSRHRDADRYRRRSAKGGAILVAIEENHVPVGYALLERTGHLDHLYVDPDHTRSGLADALLEEAESRARGFAAPHLFTEASDLARPAFERAGYRVTHRRDFKLDGVAIHNWAMEKDLA